ncbi:heat shock protein 40 [Ochromonadaceae sp. CCMP2298]|nr:heat shock protein 40 [Ochromonadaceae sp. CCMP2298]
MFFGGGDPFGGGGGGGRRGGPPVDNSKLYETLGVPKDAEENDIRRAYKKLALKNHPDKGGDIEKFKEISAAAEILCDADKRRTYDAHGMEGLEGGGGGGGGQSAEDVFSMFFGGGGGGGGRRGVPKGEDIVHQIKVSLEDLYNGKTVRLAISRKKPCQDCEGRGGKIGAERTCSDCNGRGARIQLRQIGPGMVQQVQSVCGGCRGAGKCMNEKDKCRVCMGSKVLKDRKVLEVHVERGMSHGQKVRFGGEADEVPGTEPGDVIIVVTVKEHETFQRKGADLVMKMSISLTEALTGFTRTITHLDGRVLKFTSPVGEVVKDNAVKQIKGEGMPQHGNIFNKGGLFIVFSIDFPKKLAVAKVDKIRTILGAPAAPMLSGEEEECEMKDVDVAQIGRGAGGGKSAHEEEGESEDGGQQKVQCQQN